MPRREGRIGPDNRMSLSLSEAPHGKPWGASLRFDIEMFRVILLDFPCSLNPMLFLFVVDLFDPRRTFIMKGKRKAQI